MVSARSSRQASVNAGSSAWLTPHGAHRNRGTKILRHRPAARTYRQYPDQNTSGPAHDGQVGRGNPTSRPAAAYASTASGHGHTMATGDTAPDPFSRSAQTKARRGSLTFNEDTTILTRPQASREEDIVKEHGQAPGRDAQIVRPSTARTS